MQTHRREGLEGRTEAVTERCQEGNPRPENAFLFLFCYSFYMHVSASAVTVKVFKGSIMFVYSSEQRSASWIPEKLA